jgi:hypothetical protein
MTALVLILAVTLGAFVLALALNVFEDWREAERSRRHLENLKRLGGRRDHGGWS